MPLMNEMPSTAKHRGILQLALAVRAAPLRRIWFTWLWKYLHDLPFVTTATVHDTKPGFGPTRGSHFLPEASGGRLLGLRHHRSDSCDRPQGHSDGSNFQGRQAHCKKFHLMNSIDHRATGGQEPAR